MASRLIEAADCVLVAVDVQRGFLDRVEAERAAGFLDRIAFLAASAHAAGVAGLATVETPEQWGGLHPDLAGALAGWPVLRKEVFGLADDPVVWPALSATGRGTVVLVGLETDVCVAHSALGLLDRGLRVVCVEDAVLSPGAAHEAGLARMRAAGVATLLTKQLHYEWLRTVAAAKAFGAANPGLAERLGVTL